jgi:hypothetical protein
MNPEEEEPKKPCADSSHEPTDAEKEDLFREDNSNDTDELFKGR